MTSNAEQSFVLADDSKVAHSPAGDTDANSDGNQRVDKKAAASLARLLRNNNLKSWDSATVDLQLSPTSCIDVYRDLVVQKKRLKLMPQQSASNAATEIGGERSNALITRHPAGKLALRCRKIEMETSDGNPVKYSLYLAAGFAVTQTANGGKQRVPILLIPVNISRSGRGSLYTISHTGDALRLNPNIAESCASYVDQLVKPFAKSADLRDYLRSISRKLHPDLLCRISANSGLFSLQAEVLTDLTASDQIDIEMERTRPGVEFRPIPPTPEKFNAQLAMRMARFIDQDELLPALRIFSGNLQSRQPVKTLNYDLDIHGETRVKTMKCAQWLCEVGLGHWRLESLFGLPERIKRMSTSVQTLIDQPAFNNHIDSEFQTVGILQRLYRAQQRITLAPPEMQHHAISLHADADTRLLLQKAKIQAASIEHEMEVLHDTFHMSAVPNSTALHNLVKVIAKREESSQLTNPQYFRARRQLNEILKTHNGLITDGDLQRLDAMAKTLRFAELFEQDAYYKRCFGSLFHGVNTNWQRLDSVVNFARSLSYDLNSAELVGRLTQNWPAFQRDLSSLQDTLRPAATDAHKLCSLLPLFINEKTRLHHAVRTTDKFHDKVDAWQNYLKKYVLDTSLTPYAILEKERTMQTNTTQQVSLTEQEYDERIYHHIVGVGLSTENVAATAEWLLNSIEKLNIDLPTIRRHLDAECQFERKTPSNGI